MIVPLFACFLLFLGGGLNAQKIPFNQSELYARETAGLPITPQVVINKVNKAAELLEKDGRKALPRFKGKGSPFIFGGTYMSIHRIPDGVVIMHPMREGMEGLKMSSLRDTEGKSFYDEMTRVAKNHGSGWVSYTWPRPTELKPELKVTYVKLIRVEGEEWVLKCGLYGLSESEARNLVKENP